MPVCVIGGDQDTTVGYVISWRNTSRCPSLGASCTCSTASAIRPTSEVATRCAGVLDRFVSQTVPQCLASGSSLR